MIPPAVRTTSVPLACGHVRLLRPETARELAAQATSADALFCFDCGATRPLSEVPRRPATGSVSDAASGEGRSRPLGGGGSSLHTVSGGRS